MFGWSIKIRSIQEEIFFCIWVGSFISCRNPSEEVCANNLVPSSTDIIRPPRRWSGTESPVITDKYGLRFFKSVISFAKLDKNKSG